MDEIAGRLDELNVSMKAVNETQKQVLAELKASEPLGVIEPVPSQAVTEQIGSYAPNTPWFSVDLFNRGPADKVYVAINDMSRRWTEIERDKGKTFNFGRAKINKIYYRCDANQTSVLDIEGQL